MFLSKKETCAFFFKRLLVRVLSFPEQRKEELIFLSKISNIYLPLSLEEIALRAKRERERDLLESERKKRETLLETICARA
jgi:shikimate kinase